MASRKQMMAKAAIRTTGKFQLAHPATGEVVDEHETLVELDRFWKLKFAEGLVEIPALLSPAPPPGPLPKDGEGEEDDREKMVPAPRDKLARNSSNKGAI